MKISEQTQKDIDRAFKALEDIKILANALVGIYEYEMCFYGNEEIYKLAKEYLEEDNNGTD